MVRNITELPFHEVMRGMRRRFVRSETMTFAFWEIDRGFILPEHSHYHEQVTHMLDGEFELLINGEAKLLKSGDIAIVPSNAKHSGKAINNCKILDVFSPRRKDYNF